MELTKEQILEADDLQIEKVETPEWGGHVFVRSLNADESYAYNKSNLNESGEVKDKNFIVEYCSFVMCNSKGERIFTSEDVERLGKKNTKALVRVYEVGKKLNGDDIEELEKNSETTQSEDLASD
jgi:hypothetical protein